MSVIAVAVALLRWHARGQRKGNRKQADPSELRSHYLASSDAYRLFRTSRVLTGERGSVTSCRKVTEVASTAVITPS